ncbi:MAG: aspartate-semialdehyde dehydrogenase [Acidobacteria bacterium]|nr:aspartate-semialdehyde dehydrogenase [Acidobacteriota bacterium]
MKTVGFVGWRGMVGSVLLDRMATEGDFTGFDPVFFSTSQVGQPGPAVGGRDPAPLGDAKDARALAGTDIVVTCQGGDYTRSVYRALRDGGWNGYWIDAASALRMQQTSVIVLDPVNRRVIDEALDSGTRDFIGGNCTVSLMLMGLQGLFDQGWVEWMTCMTYQSASGAGARHMTELVRQMRDLGGCHAPGQTALELERLVTGRMRNGALPTEHFEVPLAASLIPWIGGAVDNGQTREEWKAANEANKILGTGRYVPIDGQCVRVGAMRCHSQAVTVKLTADVPLADLEAGIAGANDWVEVVPNDRDETYDRLTPAAVSGHLHVPVGRIRKTTFGPDYLTCFTVGDQLLWGAAEPLRRMLLILLGRL